MTAIEKKAEGLQDRLHQYWDRASTGVRLIAVHEADALQGHWSELQERLDAALRATDGAALVKEQVDLLTESRQRLQRDHHVRVELLRGLFKDLSLH